MLICISNGTLCHAIYVCKTDHCYQYLFRYLDIPMSKLYGKNADCNSHELIFWISVKTSEGRVYFGTPSPCSFLQRWLTSYWRWKLGVKNSWRKQFRWKKDYVYQRVKTQNSTVQLFSSIFGFLFCYVLLIYFYIWKFNGTQGCPCRLKHRIFLNII